jgi:hypothetical protein
LDSDVEAFNDQFETMGYESMYMTKNLGIVCLIIIVPIVVWLVVLLMVGTCLPQYKNIEKTVRDALFCDKSFKFIYEAYMLLAMSACVNCYYLRFDSYGNVANSMLTVTTLLILVCFPIVVGILYNKMFKKVYYRDRTFMGKFGSLVQKLNFHRHGPKVFIYLWATMIRKLWLVMTLVFM